MKSLVEHVTDFCLSSHRYFAEEIWPNNPHALKITVDGKTIVPCYHSDAHVRGVLGASEAIIEALKSGSDPFAIGEALNEWNIKNKSTLALEDFSTILSLAFAAHDLGNLTKNSQLQYSSNDNTPQLLYADNFQLEVGPCEERSAKLVQHLITHFDSEKMITEPMKKLVSYLIMKTVFKPTVKSSSEPFWLLVQVIDQIGTHYFSPVPNYQTVAGYLNELWVVKEEHPRQLPPLKDFLNFQPDRFSALVPDQKMREEILEILDPQKAHTQIMKHIDAPQIPVDYERDMKKLFLGEYNS